MSFANRLRRGPLLGPALVPAILGLTSCGNSLNCTILGDNITGHIAYAPAIDIEKGSDLVIEWSNDAFATIVDSKSVQNIHGLVDVPYSACLDLDTDFVVRAFQDTNGNGVLDAGETTGLYDGTTDGNGTATTVNLPSSENNENWKVEDGADITIDATQ